MGLQKENPTDTEDLRQKRIQQNVIMDVEICSFSCPGFLPPLPMASGWQILRAGMGVTLWGAFKAHTIAVQ